MTAFVFNARLVEPDQGRTGAVPKGWYRTMVEKTEIVPTGNGAGQAINCMIGIIDGPYKGSKFFVGFNIQNASEKAVEIAYKQLSALCHAVGVLDMTDTDQLKSKPFFTRLKYVPPEMDPQDPTKVKYEDKNEPSAYRDINDQAAIEAIKTQGTAGPAKAVTAAPPPAAMAPPPAAQQQWQAPPAAQQAPAPQQWQAPPATAPAPAAAPPAGWTPPATQQPWQDPAQQAPAQQQQAAPPAQVAPNAPPPWAQPPQ